ncbi:hypothetical protein HOJ01_00280 [bacterium]|jgi:hypothetical protein|nr:hypothetical protein [bacterium]MBT6293224.1 hypothetical protein [bacterium]
MVKPKVVLLGNFDTELINAFNKEGINVCFFQDFENISELEGDILLIEKNMEDQAMQALKLKPMVPIVYKENQMFVEFDANREVGFAFLYVDNSMFSQFAAVIRAVETYKFPFDWKNLLKEVQEVLKRV